MKREKSYQLLLPRGQRTRDGDAIGEHSEAPEHFDSDRGHCGHGSRLYPRDAVIQNAEFHGWTRLSREEKAVDQHLPPERKALLPPRKK